MEFFCPTYKCAPFGTKIFKEKSLNFKATNKPQGYTDKNKPKMEKE